MNFNTSSDRNMGIPSSMLSCQVVARARAMFLPLMSQVSGTLSVVTWPRGPYVRVITRGTEGTWVHTALSQTEELQTSWKNHSFQNTNLPCIPRADIFTDGHIGNLYVHIITSNLVAYS